MLQHGTEYFATGQVFAGSREQSPGEKGRTPIHAGKSVMEEERRNL
jgi:hypothetical protein